jgi:hypothetical protein
MRSKFAGRNRSWTTSSSDLPWEGDRRRSKAAPSSPVAEASSPLCLRRVILSIVQFCFRPSAYAAGTNLLDGARFCARNEFLWQRSFHCCR